jgi:hypothetical protein
MPVTAEQIEIAKSHGMQDVELIAQCCNETGARFYIAPAMLCRHCPGNSISAISIVPIGDQVRPARSDVGRAVRARLSTNAAMMNSSIATGPKGAA